MLVPTCDQILYLQTWWWLQHFPCSPSAILSTAGKLGCLQTHYYLLDIFTYTVILLLRIGPLIYENLLRYKGYKGKIRTLSTSFLLNSISVIQIIIPISIAALICNTNLPFRTIFCLLFKFAGNDPGQIVFKSFSNHCSFAKFFMSVSV